MQDGKQLPEICKKNPVYPECRICQQEVIKIISEVYRQGVLDQGVCDITIYKREWEDVL